MNDHPTREHQPSRVNGFAFVGILLALAAVLLSTAVFARRVHEAWSAAGVAPGTATTSGCETESHFALWRAAHHEPVYLDSRRSPFASAYFNWLFYAAYAVPARVGAAAWGEVGILRMSRIMSGAGAATGIALLLWFLRCVRPNQNALMAALATFVFWGPLVGWWSQTTRPDVWALALETAAVATLLRWHRSSPRRAIALSFSFFFAAWSCKQTYVFGLATALVYLTLSRRWQLAAILAGGSVAAWLATLWWMGPAYRVAQQETAVTNVYYLTLGLENLADALKKSAPLCVFAAAALISARTVRHTGASTLAHDTKTFGAIGVLTTLPLAFMGSCKLGAGSYYYFTPVLMLALAGAGALAERSPAWIDLATAGAILALQALTLTGRAGQISLAPQTQELARSWQVYRTLPEPRFSCDLRLNLPWLNPASPPLVLAYNYRIDLRAGKQFESGGIGGMIERGYFAALLLPLDTGDDFLGGRLSRYHRDHTVGNLIVFRRSP